MEALQIDAHEPITRRAQRVREAFQKATPEKQSKIFELIPFTKKTDDNSNIIDFCDWQQWSQWSQSR